MDSNRKIIYADDLLSAIRDDMTIRGAAYAAVVKHINAAPAVEAAPVVRGYWKTKEVKAPYGIVYHNIVCSVCDVEAEEITNGGGMELLSEFCPHCGSIMDLSTKKEGVKA